MNKLILTLIAIPIILLAQEKLSIAVMELDGNGVSESDLGGLSERLRAELFQTGAFDVIERSRMDDILKEQGFQQTGCTDAACAVEIGQLIGVRKIVVGSVSKVGSIYSVAIRMVDVGTGKVAKIASEDCDDCIIGNVLKVTMYNVARVLAGLDADKVVEKKPLQAQPTYHTDPVPSAPAGLQEWEKLGLKNRDDWVKFKKSGLSIENWEKQRSAVVAMTLTVLLPSVGHTYSYGTLGIPVGLAYTGTEVAFLIAGRKALMSMTKLDNTYAPFGWENAPPGEYDKRNEYRQSAITRFIIMGSVHVLAIAHVGIVTGIRNKRLKGNHGATHISFYPHVAIIGNRLIVGINRLF